MTIKEQLMEDYKVSMKSHDEVAKNTISFARAAIKQYEIDNRGEELDDQGVIAILSKQVKMRKDALSDFEKAGRTDLIDSYTQEIAILERYLPAQLSADDLKKAISEVAASLGIGQSSGPSNMGRLMGAAMSKLKGLADGNDVKTFVQEYLK